MPNGPASVNQGDAISDHLSARSAPPPSARSAPLSSLPVLDSVLRISAVDSIR
jgi:hypothetical protein